MDNQNNNCHACGMPKTHLFNWSYSGFGDSIFNYKAEFYDCKHCGLICINNIDDMILSKFYAEECNYFANAHFDINAKKNIEKFQYYKNLLVEVGVNNLPITDIGCGRGGFITWLMQNNWQSKCCGVDVDVKSLPDNTKNSPKFINGFAKDLPFENNSQKVLTYFHVFEHIVDTDAILQEAYRVLDEDGIIVIEVPDAQNYSKESINGGFWVSIREHIYHFTFKSLVELLNKNGFSILTIKQDRLPTPEFDYQSLIVVASKQKQQKYIFKNIKIDNSGFFISSQEDIKNSANKIVDRSKQYDSVVFWGVSNQLLSILPILEHKINFTLCDASEQKQALKYKNKLILSPNDIDYSNSLLVVSSYLHRQAIKSAAIKMGWDAGSIINLVE